MEIDYKCIDLEPASRKFAFTANFICTLNSD